MKEEVKKREQKSKTPLAFRVSPAAYHAWKAVARNSPDSEARLFEDTVKEVYRRAYASGTLKGELFNVYQIQELFNKYGPFPRVDIRGYEEVQGKHKTTPNLGEEDAIQLLSEKLLSNMGELEELLSTGAATYVDRFLNADGFEVDRYATSIGDFEKTKESRSKHSWGRQEATNREMVSVDDVTEDDFENAIAIERTGHAGDYHVVYQLPDGRRFFRREIVEIPLRLEKDAIAFEEPGREESELPRVYHGKDGGLLFLHLRTCGSREWQIVDQAINWEANDNPKTVAAVAKEFNLDRQVVATYVINAIRKVLYMSLEIDMEKLVGKKGPGGTDGKPCEKLGKILTNQMRPDRPAYKWLQKFLVDNASWIIAEKLGAELVDESNENDEVHKVYEIDFDDIYWGNYYSGFTTGIAGEWEIHAHRSPFSKTTTFEARLKPSDIEAGKKAVLVHYYPDRIETHSSGAFWSEYHYGKSHIVRVLTSEIGSVCSYHSGSFEDAEAALDSVMPVVFVMQEHKAKHGRIPTADEIWPLLLESFSPENRKKLDEKIDPTVGKSLWRQAVQLVTQRATQKLRFVGQSEYFDDFENYDPEVGPVWSPFSMELHGQKEWDECWALAICDICFEVERWKRPEPETLTNAQLLRIYKTQGYSEEGKKDGSGVTYYARWHADGKFIQARFDSLEDVKAMLAPLVEERVMSDLDAEPNIDLDLRNAVLPEWAKKDEADVATTTRENAPINPRSKKTRAGAKTGSKKRSDKTKLGFSEKKQVGWPCYVPKHLPNDGVSEMELWKFGSGAIGPLFKAPDANTALLLDKCTSSVDGDKIPPERVVETYFVRSSWLLVVEADASAMLDQDVVFGVLRGEHEANFNWSWARVWEDSEGNYVLAKFAHNCVWSKLHESSIAPQEDMLVRSGRMSLG